MMPHGEIVVDVLTNCPGQIVESYNHNPAPHYANYRVRFPPDEYRIVLERHMRPAMPAEVRWVKRSLWRPHP